MWNEAAEEIFVGGYQCRDDIDSASIITRSCCVLAPLADIGLLVMRARFAQDHDEVAAAEAESLLDGSGYCDF